MRKRTVAFKLGELFCGPGGLAYGAVKASVKKNSTEYKIEHQWASDIDINACNTYAHNICPQNPDSIICEDVRKLNINKLKNIDIFAYGFPCNDFSNVGEKKGFNGKYGELYLYGIEIINIYKPKIFVAENVTGIKNVNEGKSFKKILLDLKNAGKGYNLTVNLYKAEEYGVPQIRHRIVIVGIEKASDLTFNVPQPTHINSYVTVKDILDTQPIAKNAFNNELTIQSKTVIERLKYIAPGENAWTLKIPPHLRLNVKNAKLSQIYKRLDPDKPAYTITGSGGGGTHGYHWKENRALTNRERARIQTFPDNYEFCGAKESVRKQIGMAVPPKLSEIIFTSILKTFTGIKYPFVLPNISLPEQSNIHYKHFPDQTAKYSWTI